MINVTQCGQTFYEGIKAGNQTILDYVYHGYTGLLYTDGAAPPMITFDGCIALCGTGSDPYDWSGSSSTISTWILPIIGLLLQAPFESNRFWATCFALLHWIGSPVSSMAAVFWNIEVSNRCSLMVDMAVSYAAKPKPGLRKQYRDIRDAFYLLGVMNQYTIDKTIPRGLAERLIRVALFSDSLTLKWRMSEEAGDINQLSKCDCNSLVPSHSTASLPTSIKQRSTAMDHQSTSSNKEFHDQNLVTERARLAEHARQNRKRGVVPVMITLGWFIFSFIVSIQLAFGQLGLAAQAHDLALGLLLAWVPIFVLSCIVDRNPTQPEAIRDDLNEFINRVKEALTDKRLLENYIHACRRPESSFEWIQEIRNHGIATRELQLFRDFAGQGRRRWHYGIAHDVLDGNEEWHILESGRGWLQDSELARDRLVVGPEDMEQSFTRTLNHKSLWQVICATMILGLCCVGAGILSYFEPPQGIGCRSGGYLVFLAIAVSLWILEASFWVFIPKHSQMGIRKLSVVTTKVPLFQRVLGFDWVRQATTRDYLNALLTAGECINTGWLTYIICAQSFGLYRSCECEGSLWFRSVGFFDFSSEQSYLGTAIQSAWISGTTIVAVVMSVHFTYIVHEWCTQSHLNARDYEKSQRGLSRTRWYRSKILWFQKILWFASDTFALLWLKCFWGKPHQRRKTLRWTPDSRPSKHQESGFCDESQIGQED